MKRRMNTSSIVATMVFACLNLFAQGTVDFANDNASLVRNSLGGGLIPQGTTFKAALYYLPDQPNEPTPSQFDSFDGEVPLGNSAGFTSPGLFDGGTRTTSTSTSPGGAAWFQVRVWETAFGTSYEQAIVAPVIAGRKALVGTYKIIRVGQTGVSGQTPPANLTSWGLQALSLVPVPLGERYNFNNCAVPSGTSVNGAARVATDGAGNCVVHLTDAGQFQTNGVFVIPDLAGGSNVNHIHIHWRSRVGGATSGASQFGRLGADGYSLSWGTDAATTGGSVEGTGTGLIVTVDTWDNGGG